ncbi:MAG: hypothetical protein AB7D28_09970 [Candidatus Berkiella sp.]|jgi:Sec-independent protein translocase protein TatA
MGQIGFGEILVVVIVAICVLKPDQLQSISFMLGKLWGKTNKQLKTLKAELKQTIDPPAP